MRNIAKTIVAVGMLGLGIFNILYFGSHLGMEQGRIIGNIWIVGAILLAWMPNENDD